MCTLLDVLTHGFNRPNLPTSGVVTLRVLYCRQHNSWRRLCWTTTSTASLRPTTKARAPRTSTKESRYGTPAKSDGKQARCKLLVLEPFRLIFAHICIDKTLSSASLNCVYYHDATCTERTGEPLLLKGQFKTLEACMGFDCLNENPG